LSLETSSPAAAAADAGKFDVDPGAFLANWDPSQISRPGADEWSALPLMNKGILLPNGCAAAPQTCEALRELEPFLAPRAPAATVAKGDTDVISAENDSSDS
jgi:hypothetical protein